MGWGEGLMSHVEFKKIIEMSVVAFFFFFFFFFKDIHVDLEIVQCLMLNL